MRRLGGVAYLLELYNGTVPVAVAACSYLYERIISADIDACQSILRPRRELHQHEKNSSSSCHVNILFVPPKHISKCPYSRAISWINCPTYMYCTSCLFEFIVRPSNNYALAHLVLNMGSFTELYT